MSALPGNMIVGMGAAAALCTVFGVLPGLLYGWLPHDMSYRPYTLAHIVESLQLLTFTLLAFIWLRQTLEPEDKIVLDTDWFYRRPRKWVEAVCVGGINSGFTRVDERVWGWARALAVCGRNPVEMLRTMRLPDARYMEDKERALLGSLVLIVVLVVLGVALAGLL